VVKRTRRHGNNGSNWKPITVEETIAICHCSERHFHRVIKQHLQIKRPGRRLLINEYSVHRYLRNLPDVNG
jgi:AraC-like DNA-binding protein